MSITRRSYAVYTRNGNVAGFFFFSLLDTLISGGGIEACWRSGNAGALQSTIHRFDSCTGLNFSPSLAPELSTSGLFFFSRSAMLNIGSTEKEVINLVRLSGRRDDDPEETSRTCGNAESTNSTF